jgi:hypothetical protein
VPKWTKNQLSGNNRGSLPPFLEKRTICHPKSLEKKSFGTATFSNITLNRPRASQFEMLAKSSCDA